MSGAIGEGTEQAPTVDMAIAEVGRSSGRSAALHEQSAPRSAVSIAA
jgi:hypothetical protein